MLMPLGDRNDRQLQEWHVRYFYCNFRIFHISHFIHDFASLLHYSTFAFYTLSILHFRTFALSHFISRRVITSRSAVPVRSTSALYTLPRISAPHRIPRVTYKMRKCVSAKLATYKMKNAKVTVKITDVPLLQLSIVPVSQWH